MILEVPVHCPGNGRQGRQLDAATEGLEGLFQALDAPAPIRHQAGQGQGRFGQSEAAGCLAIVQQILELADLDPHAQIDRADPDHGLLDHPNIRLDRRLAVQIHRGVGDAAAPFQGIGRGVRPAAAEIQPGRSAGPDDLIAAQHTVRRRTFLGTAGHDGLLQMLESRLLHPPAPVGHRHPVVRLDPQRSESAAGGGVHEVSQAG
jgi:hypothetical protein